MLELKNICYSVIDGEIKKDILKDISFRIKDNELVVITGPNGSGKSTLAKIIMGILKPNSGEILYNGQKITDLSITDRANLGFGFAFQQPVCFKGLSVKDLIDIASKKSNTIKEACEYLAVVGLCAREYINRQINNKLSGGELKRIEIASLLAKNANINVFDEPEAGIDLWSFDALVELFKSKTSTNVIISHQPKIIEIAHKVILMRNGSIEKIGKYSDVLPLMQRQKCAKIVEGN